MTQVTVVMDGRRRSFAMRAEHDTVLEAAERLGPRPALIRAVRGVCSTCRTRVVRGAVKMAQNYALEPWEVEARLRAVLPVAARLRHRLELSYDER